MKRRILNFIFVISFALAAMLIMGSCEKCEHNYLVTSEPNCETGGERVYTCSICNGSYTETVVGASHEYSLTSIPDCRLGGDRVYTCDVCGYSYTEAVEPTEHEYADGICIHCGAEILYSRGLEYISNGDGTCYVARIGSCTDTEILIPPTVPEGTVTAIGKDAFYSSELKKVLIPDTVTVIGEGAFRSCRFLVSISLPEGVKRIEGHAFNGCDNLQEITLPNSVEYIGERVFMRCDLLYSITLPFLGATRDVDNYYKDNITYLFGEQPSEISERLRRITLTDEKNIPSFAFESCRSLSSVTFGEGTSRIEESAFHGCTNLSSVIIPKSVTYIGRYVFSGCGVVSICFEGTEEEWAAITKDPDIFDGVRGFTVTYNYTREDK